MKRLAASVAVAVALATAACTVDLHFNPGDPLVDPDAAGLTPDAGAPDGPSRDGDVIPDDATTDDAAFRDDGGAVPDAQPPSDS